MDKQSQLNKLRELIDPPTDCMFVDSTRNDFLAKRFGAPTQKTNDAKLTVATIAELQNEIATQREVICNLTSMNDRLQSKLDKIEKIIKNHDNDSMPEDYWYIDRIREVLEQEKNYGRTI